jgi:hypothetical protein
MLLKVFAVMFVIGLLVTDSAAWCRLRLVLGKAPWIRSHATTINGIRGADNGAIWEVL